jgi:hypothetical protein
LTLDFGVSNLIGCDGTNALALEIGVDDLRGVEVRGLLEEHLDCMVAVSPPEMRCAEGVGRGRIFTSADGLRDGRPEEFARGVWAV